MPDYIPEISGGSIVLLGTFNPTIFQPEWLVRQHFETEKYVLQVTNEKFVAASKPNASSAPLRDLVHGAFFILEHTPVTPSPSTSTAFRRKS